MANNSLRKKSALSWQNANDSEAELREILYEILKQADAQYKEGGYLVA